MKHLDRSRLTVILSIIGFTIFTISCKNESIELYKDKTQSVDARVKDLLKKMTLEEKIAQTYGIWQYKSDLFTNSQFDSAKAAQIMPYGIGHYGRLNEGAKFSPATGTGLSPKENAILGNTIQKYFIENTRLGIPVIFHEESLHGHQATEATSFPSPLGMSCSWNEELLSEVYSNIAKEVRYRGGHQVLAPVVDITIDPRWGRTEETLGEDPYLTSRLGVAIVKAYQGNTDHIDKEHVAVTLKHFGVHGQSEGGSNKGPVFFSERHLRQYFLKPFQACIEKGKAMNVMAAYPEIDGIPSHADKWLLTDVLRNEWGFKGTVVSDYGGIWQLIFAHYVAKNEEDAALMAIKAGVDIELPDVFAYKSLKKLIETGKLPISVLDETVSRILRTKFLLGLFDDPYVDPEKAEEFVGNEYMRSLALKAARQSIVLLKNNTLPGQENNILPIDRSKYKKIAVIGPNADKCILGGYSDEPKQKISPIEAIKEKYPDVELSYAQGCKLLKDRNPDEPYIGPVIADHKENLNLINEAISVAKNADIIVLMLGGNNVISREAIMESIQGDLTNLDLLSDQNELVSTLKKLNKPMVAFVFSGPPIAFTELNNNVDALAQCWYLGQETGYAVAETLFGDNNPSGKLTISIPRSVGHIPVYYYHKPSARLGYNFETTSALYPFGYGLSYTSFEYKNLAVSNTKMSKKDSVTVSVDVENTGNYDGEEIIQLYIHDLVSSITRPVKELKDFKRISLKKGEIQNVSFTVAPDKLKFYNKEMKEVVEPGDFEIMVGSSSDKYDKILITVTE